MNFVLAVANHFCLSLPAAFTQPGQSLSPEPVALYANQLSKQEFSPHARLQGLEYRIFSLSLMLLLLSTPLVNQNSRGEVEAIHAHHGMDGMGKEGGKEGTKVSCSKRLLGTR